MNEGAAADEAHARLQAILKAVVVGRDVADAASREAGESEALFQSAGALIPPYDPEALCLLVEHSNALRQNLDAYAVNIDGFGHRLEPAIDFEAEDADTRVADAIFLERAAAQERGDLAVGAELEPSADEVAARKREQIHLARVERARLQSFFDFCCFDHSFVDLRRRTRQDLETTGNAFWEVLRDGRGQIARLVYVPSHTVRLMPLDPEPVEVDDRVQISPVTFEDVKARRRMRRFVYFENKSVPPLALLISGGRLSESSVPRIERFIEENLKGRANFHKNLILEAEGGQGDNRARIEVRPLTEAQQQDALFQVYDERNIDKVGGAFRLPRLLRGESKDFNRATAESALRFAEDQVFQPERDELRPRFASAVLRTRALTSPRRGRPSRSSPA